MNATSWEALSINTKLFLSFQLLSRCWPQALLPLPTGRADLSWTSSSRRRPIETASWPSRKTSTPIRSCTSSAWPRRPGRASGRGPRARLKGSPSGNSTWAGSGRSKLLSTQSETNLCFCGIGENILLWILIVLEVILLLIFESPPRVACYNFYPIMYWWKMNLLKKWKLALFYSMMFWCVCNF